MFIYGTWPQSFFHFFPFGPTVRFDSGRFNHYATGHRQSLPICNNQHFSILSLVSILNWFIYIFGTTYCIIYIYYINTHIHWQQKPPGVSYTNRRPCASRIRDAHGGLLIIPQQLIGAALPKGGRFAEGRHVHLTSLAKKRRGEWGSYGELRGVHVADLKQWRSWWFWNTERCLETWNRVYLGLGCKWQEENAGYISKLTKTLWESKNNRRSNYSNYSFSPLWFFPAAWRLSHKWWITSFSIHGIHGILMGFQEDHFMILGPHGPLMSPPVRPRYAQQLQLGREIAAMVTQPCWWTAQGCC